MNTFSDMEIQFLVSKIKRDCEWITKTGECKRMVWRVDNSTQQHLLKCDPFACPKDVICYETDKRE